MSQLNTQLGHAIYLRDTLAGHEVQAVQVLLVGLDHHLVLRCGYRDNRLEEGTLALLDVLTHRVQVGREGYAGGEDTLAFLALRLTVELLPPLVDILQLRLVRTEDLDLLAIGIEQVTHGSVDRRRVLLEGYALGRLGLHLLGTLHQGAHIDTGYGQRQQTYGRQYRETTAYIVRNHERGVALVGCEGLQSTTCLVRYGYDALGSLSLAIASLQLGLDQAEGDSRLGRRTRLRDHDGADRVLLRSLHQLVGVVLRDVLAGKDNGRILLLLLQELEGVRHRLQHRLGAEVRTTDTDADHQVTLFAQLGGGSYDGVQLSVIDRRGEVYPTQEVVAFALARVEQCVGSQCFGFHFGRNLIAGLRVIDFHGCIGFYWFRSFFVRAPSSTCGPNSSRRVPNRPYRQSAFRPCGGS